MTKCLTILDIIGDVADIKPNKNINEFSTCTDIAMNLFKWLLLPTGIKSTCNDNDVLEVLTMNVEDINDSHLTILHDALMDTDQREQIINFVSFNLIPVKVPDEINEKIAEFN